MRHLLLAMAHLEHLGSDEPHCSAETEILASVALALNDEVDVA